MSIAVFHPCGIKRQLLHSVLHSVVPENIHTPPTEGIGNSWGVGGSRRPKNLSKCMKLDWNFQRGGGGERGGGSKEKSLLWGRYG